MKCALRRRVGLLVLWGVLVVLGGQPVTAGSPDDGPFAFIAAADMRMFTGPDVYDSCRYFRGVVEKMVEVGPGEFLITPGDFDPVNNLRWTLDQVLGPEYPWYPVVGNHELPGYGWENYAGENMEILRAYDYDAQRTVVRWGPGGCLRTTYSFDYRNAHFVALNLYCDVDGDTKMPANISDHLYEWLARDLAETDKDFIFVFGHEPAYAQPDLDTGRERYIGEGLALYPANRGRFWELLREHQVTAYINGHTHNYSAVQVAGLWQVDVGHARGGSDLGAPSTFVRVTVQRRFAYFETYRVQPDNLCAYQLRQRWAIRQETPNALRQERNFLGRRALTMAWGYFTR